MVEASTSSNNEDNHDGQLPPPPRILYGAFFAWLSISCGRFIAPFLKHEAGLSDELIGFAVALQVGISSSFSIIGSSWADDLERKYPHRGRSYVILSGMFTATFFFLLHGTWRIFPQVSFFQSVSWHMILRCLYSISVSVIYPVLDGITLAHLNEEPGRERVDYGEERLHGAIWWGITNLVMGPFVDCFGYSTMYFFALISTPAALYAIKIYVLGKLNWQSSIQQQQQRNIMEENSNSTNKENNISDYKNNGNGGEKNNKEKLLPVSKILLQITFYGTIATAFFLSYFCLYIGLPVVENLGFLYFEFLGGSNTLNGLTVAFTVLFEIPVFHIAPKLLRKFGPSTLLLMANIAFIIRVIGYTLIPEGNVYLVLFLEPLHGIIFGCSQAGSVEYVSELITSTTTITGYEAIGQSLLAILRGIGGVLGLSIGGIIQQNFGPRDMYRTMASIVTGGSIFFVFVSNVHSSSSRFLPSERSDELEPIIPTRNGDPSNTVAQV